MIIVLKGAPPPTLPPTPLKKGTCELKGSAAFVVGAGICSSLAIPETCGF